MSINQFQSQKEHQTCNYWNRAAWCALPEAFTLFHRFTAPSSFALKNNLWSSNANFKRYSKFHESSPVWRNKWFLRLVCLENPLEQMWHLKGQDPEWTYMWDRRSPGVGKDLLHKLHLWGLSWKKENHCYWVCY